VPISAAVKTTTHGGDLPVTTSWGAEIATRHPGSRRCYVQREHQRGPFHDRGERKQRMAQVSDVETVSKRSLMFSKHTLDTFVQVTRRPCSPLDVQVVLSRQ
jgi:hypothetical protein